MKTSDLASRLANIGNWQELAVQSHYRAACFARLCNVTPRTLQRYFQNQLHTSPQRWLDEVRQFQAELLIKTGERTKQIANLLGYENASHFCHQFKRHHGLSAKQWRAESARPPIRPRRSNTPAIKATFVADKQSFAVVPERAVAKKTNNDCVGYCSSPNERDVNYSNL